MLVKLDVENMQKLKTKTIKLETKYILVSNYLVKNV